MRPGGRVHLPLCTGVSQGALAAIHKPHAMTIEDQERSGCQIGLDYPAQIVDHQRVRQEYLDWGKAAKVDS